jgi:DsbC/DsbD-like thiol-disulfide interchange protein
VPKKKKIAEDMNQPSPESGAPAATKKTSKRQPPGRATTAKRPRKPSETRAAGGQTAHISASPQADVMTVSGEPSDDAVRLRAYFISERRRRFALPGDAESDWLEAKRQLLAEARR